MSCSTLLENAKIKKKILKELKKNSLDIIYQNDFIF